MSMKQTITIGVMALGLLFTGCQESGMEANQDSAQIPAGTQLYVRANQPSSGSPYKAGDEFHGTLERAIEVNGQTIVPAGTMVHGEFTNDLGDRARDRMGTDMDRDRDADASGTAGDSGDPTIARRDRAGDADAGAETEGRRDRDATAEKREQLGVELGKIVINGEEYDIDTEPVPLPGTAGSYPGQQGSGTESASGSAALSSSMVFTLSDNVEIPTNTAKSE